MSQSSVSVPVMVLGPGLVPRLRLAAGPTVRVARVPRVPVLARPDAAAQAHRTRVEAARALGSEPLSVKALFVVMLCRPELTVTAQYCVHITFKDFFLRIG